MGLLTSNSNSGAATAVHETCTKGHDLLSTPGKQHTGRARAESPGMPDCRYHPGGGLGEEAGGYSWSAVGSIEPCDRVKHSMTLRCMAGYACAVRSSRTCFNTYFVGGNAAHSVA